MYERHPEPTEPDETKHNQAAELVDKLGISWAEARSRLGILESDTVDVSHQEPMRVYPAAMRRRYQGRSRPAVGEDSEDVMTGILSDEQVTINRRGIALVRAVLATDRKPLSAYDVAVARAKQEKKDRR